MKTLIKNFYTRLFLLFFTIILIFFSLFSLYTYNTSKKIIEEELSMSSEQNIIYLTKYIEQYIEDTKYTISTLVINRYIRSLLAPEGTHYAAEYFLDHIMDQLLVLTNNNEAISAIYIYSEYNNTIYTATKSVSLDDFKDKHWLSLLTPDEYGFSTFPYAMNNLFPYTICVTQEFDIHGNHAAICILIDLFKLSLLANQVDLFQEFFIIADDGQIIYRKDKREFYEPVAAEERLLQYDPSVYSQTCIYDKNTDSPYVLSQMHSEEYSWTYVLYTPLQNYISRLSSARTVSIYLLLAFLFLALILSLSFTLHSQRPLRYLRYLLDNPQLNSDNSKLSSADIDFVAAKITQYMQSNNHLATELNHRLNLLTQTRLQSLQYQINPHFLFNTLGILHIMAAKYLGPSHELPNIIIKVSSLLRFALEPEFMVTLKEELSYTDIYLYVLNKRYSKKLIIKTDIQESTLGAKVPRLILQPLIENAIFHAFSHRQHLECILTIGCYLQENLSETGQQYLTLTIKDNGVGLDNKTIVQLISSMKENPTVSSKKIGLRNVYQRLMLSYADDASIEINSTPNVGTCFTITIPFIK